MEDTKKRGRPAAKSDAVDTGAGGSGGGSTIPKKRGRPANPDKVKKPPSGRGRGRPAKNPSNAPAKKRAPTDGSDEDGVANGDSTGTPGRGRPPKMGKLKVGHKIEATGKGRGRPKNPPKSDQEDDDADEDAEDDDDDDSAGYSPGGGSKKVNKVKSPKKSGRPKKVAHSDDDDEDRSDGEDDDEEKRPLGRPATGAVNLNIERTGRGQGRPKKAAAGAKRVVSENGGDGEGSPKKRGRPSLGNKAYVPSGKPRGRPKVNIDDNQESENELDARERSSPEVKEVTLKYTTDEDDEEDEDEDAINSNEEVETQKETTVAT